MRKNKCNLLLLLFYLIQLFDYSHQKTIDLNLRDLTGNIYYENLITIRELMDQLIARIYSFYVYLFISF